MALRFFLLSVLSVVLFGLLSLFCLARFSAVTTKVRHEEFLRFVLDTVEQNINEEVGTAELSDAEFNQRMTSVLLHMPPPRSPMRRGMRPPTPYELAREGKPRGLPPHRLGLWLVNARGDILSNGTGGQLPSDWRELAPQTKPHDITSSFTFFSFRPRTFVARLDNPREIYLVSSDEGLPMTTPMFMTQAVLMVITLALALFFALSVIFFYLRRKSIEARAVLLRLERGDLKARFAIQRFDEFGGLLLDFNRMAEEIERLVSKVHATEAARKNMMQELGHDVRTPLTSLTTSFETLQKHFARLSDEDRRELFDMIGAEVDYLRYLVEKLMTIATIDEPHYKKSTELIDLTELLEQEVSVRRNSDARNVQWKLDVAPPLQSAKILGDPHLILRLLKNAFDNASRFAKDDVRIKLSGSEKSLQIEVADNGPGLTPTELDGFARRREQRSRREGTLLNFSLGLGSVIMKAIAELHGGSIEIQNGAPGARLLIRLPRP